MTPEQFLQVERNGAVVDLSARAKWRVTGGDRVRYLNGQVTNDVRRAKEDEALYACVTNAKGRIDGDVCVHAAPGPALSLDAEPGLRDLLSARLEKYVVADDVVIEDVTGDWKLFHLLGAAGDRLAPASALFAEGHGRIVRNNRTGVAGVDVWLGAAEPVPAFPVPELTEADAEIWRICHGVPRWPNELNAGSFPQEAGLESRAMDFSKGCYLGQEVLSRIKTTGRMPRTLVRFEVCDAAFRTPASTSTGTAMSLWLRSAEGLKEAGVVTSACLHPALDRVIGLAYVRQGLEREPSLLLAPEGASSILTQVHLPKQ